MMKQDTLYYDGHCPICSAEVSKLRQQAGPDLALVDIHDLPEDSELPPRDVLLETLHLKTRDNRLLGGVDANVAAWQHTRFGFLWRFLRWRWVKPVADVAYRRWATVRYRRLYRREPHP